MAAGLGLILGLQLLRVFLPLATFYLYDAEGLPPLATAGISLVLFAVGLRAPALARRAGWYKAVRWIVGLLALLRIAEQLSPSPAVDARLAATGMAVFSGLLGLLLLAATRSPAVRSQLAFCVVLALALETAIRTLAGTLDLSWHGHPAADVAVLALGGAALAAVAWPGGRAGSSAIASRPWDWLALGSWMGLYLLVFSNPAHLAARAGMPLERAGWFVLGGWLAGLVAAAIGTLGRPRPWRAAEASALAGIGTWVAVFGEEDAWFGVLIGAPGMAVLLFDLLGTRPGRAASGRAAGAAGPVLLIWLYLVYGRFDQSFGPSEPTIYLLALGALIAVSLATAWRARPDPLPPARRPWLAGFAVTLGVFAVGSRLLGIPASPPAPVAADPVRVLTYNIHQGFDTSGRLDPEALARVIEAQEPDVVALQEVARGWLVTGGLDLHSWLGRRLGMRGAFAGTADPQWGNAVLTRLPILASAYHPLPDDDLPLRRGVLDMTLAAEGGPLRILCTHFHHRRADDAVRVRQARELLRIWDGTPSTVLLGDFNAVPGSEAIRLLHDAGLGDASVLLAPTERSTIARGGMRQIDWIFATPDLELTETVVPFTQSSDHLPVATTVQRRAAAGEAGSHTPPG